MSLVSYSTLLHNAIITPFRLFHFVFVFRFLVIQKNKTKNKSMQQLNKEQQHEKTCWQIKAF